MFVRTETKTKTKTKTGVLNYTSENNPDILIEKLQSRERVEIDYGSQSTSSLIVAALRPFAITCLLIFLTPTLSPRWPDMTTYAQQAVPKELVSLGAVLAREDTRMQSKDYTFVLPAGDDMTVMYVWDYAAEDGDMVSVMFNGKAVGDSFRIMHAPRVIKVPRNTKVEVIGTHDGGGGITYAVSFPEANKTVLNGVEAGDKNIYTLQAPKK